MAFALIASAVASAGIGYAGGLWPVAALWGVEAVAQAAGGPAQSALLTDVIGEARRGRAFGLYLTVAGLAGSAGPIIGGWLYDRATPQTPFLLNAGVLAVCGVVVLLAGSVLFGAASRASTREARTAK